MEKKYMLLGAVVAGLVVGFGIYRGAGKVVEVAKDAAEAVNPFNNDNVINQGFEYLYRELTGSEGNPGSDFYDATHGGALDITSNKNFINQGAEGFYRALTGSKASIGSDLYDATHGGALDITSDQNFIYKGVQDTAKITAWGAGQVVDLLDPRNIAKRLEDWFK
jgi:hypothetical protein